jgi:A/G-specific adenine glycosylase
VHGLRRRFPISGGSVDDFSRPPNWKCSPSSARRGACPGPRKGLGLRFAHSTGGVSGQTPRVINAEHKRRLHRQLLTWYRQHGRHDLPWRQTRDPWLVLLAEVLLQRTRADLVDPVFRRLVLAYPTATDMAFAPPEQVDAILEPLGLRHRFPRVRQLATRSQRGVPQSVDRLLELPGVGKYVAHATACFAFGRRLPVIDPNVIRVLGRLGLATSTAARPRDDARMWTTAGSLLPARRVREWNYALLDLGALVCQRRPRCEVCPLISLCPTGQARSR